jgi:hypothetical protein
MPKKEIEIVGEDATIDGVVLNNDFMYISDGTWYVKDSICHLDANCGFAGALMIGIRAEDNLLDGELCSWEEFDIYSSDRVLIKEASTDEED